MTVYVDNERVQWKGREWCHLVADSLAELHEFGRQLRLQREWFQENASYPHYDVTTSKRSIALTLGAVPGDRRTIIRCAKKLKLEMSLDKPEHTVEVFNVNC